MERAHLTWRGTVQRGPPGQYLGMDSGDEGIMLWASCRGMSGGGAGTAASAKALRQGCAWLACR